MPLPLHPLLRLFSNPLRRPRKKKRATSEQTAAAAAGFGDAKVEESEIVNTGTPLKGRRDE
jgi:hypothetical protein